MLCCIMTKIVIFSQSKQVHVKSMLWKTQAKKNKKRNDLWITRTKKLTF